MILLHAWAQRMRNGMPTPKNYPYWPDLIARLAPAPLVQVAAKGEQQLVPDLRVGLSLPAISDLLRACDYWIAVDSFLPHLAHHLPKPGVVLWGLSDPEIFGYPENLNLLKDRRYLRRRQFRMWEEQSVTPQAFLDPDTVVAQIHAWTERTVYAT